MKSQKVLKYRIMFTKILKHPENLEICRKYSKTYQKGLNVKIIWLQNFLNVQKSLQILKRFQMLIEGKKELQYSQNV